MTVMVYDYAGHQVLFRQAKARAMAARRFATQADLALSEGRSGVERQQRERDAVISVLILTQGAAEGYANRVHLEACTTITIKDTWIRRWEKIADAAGHLDRPTDFALNDDQRGFLTDLGAWRNYLLHADAKACERLYSRLVAVGSLDEATSPVDLLTADLAETIIHKADRLFRWAEDKTGIQAPFLDAAWVAPDE
jgi:hypothetical protein